MYSKIYVFKVDIVLTKIKFHLITGENTATLNASCDMKNALPPIARNYLTDLNMLDTNI